MVVSLFLGLLLGIRHALEADHIAAVAALASRAHSLKDHVKLASAWGLGHAGALIAFGALVLTLGLSLPDAIVRGLEAVVGFVMIGLGIDVLRRLRNDHVHFHVHQHQDGMVHVHAHAHVPGVVHHDRHAHAHEHQAGAVSRAVLVGSVHGLAGSAALVLLPLPGSTSALQPVAYLVAFGLGSILGMVMFSITLSIPLRLSAQHLGPALRGIQGALGVLTIAIGCWISATVFFGGGPG